MAVGWKPRSAALSLWSIAALLVLAGCTRQEIEAPHRFFGSSVPITASARALAPGQSCGDVFVRHSLDHTTVAGDQVVALYESNGSGTALNDLDEDGDLDIVLANLHGPNSILWNEGHLRFRTEHLAHGDSRGVAIVDVDGDGRQDIVFTRRLAKPSFWRNTGAAGDARFVEGELPNVHNPFYSMNWGDLDGDGDLDLVAGSYDTELRKSAGAIFDYQGGGVGVFVYTNQGEGFEAQRLAAEADALTIALPDLDADGRPDILVGNDFDRQDNAWLRSDDGWTVVEPFPKTTENTMSLDVGDVDNDGRAELFATDMKPYLKDVRTMATWMPMMQKMSHPKTSADPQIVENVLQVRDERGRFRNEGYQRGVDATGWSWSSKFGDLDQDGFLDLYVVNGMIAHDIFSYLPDEELREQNQALRNDGGGYFRLAPEWGLGSTASGRGMSMADLDDDGDLDIVVNNLQAPAELWENRLCGGKSLLVDLFWPDSMNRRALGAQLVLRTSVGDLTRDVRAASGYLSGDAARVHFGFPADVTLERLEIRWPDGNVSHLDSTDAQTLVSITR
jgi:hypothetical protein